MIEIIDFTNCSLSSRNLEYAGRAGEKREIIYNNKYWFLTQIKREFSYFKLNRKLYYIKTMEIRLEMIKKKI